jgi:hypothetical protein
LLVRKHSSAWPFQSSSSGLSTPAWPSINTNDAIVTVINTNNAIVSMIDTNNAIVSLINSNNAIISLINADDRLGR